MFLICPVLILLVVLLPLQLPGALSFLIVLFHSLYPYLLLLLVLMSYIKVRVTFVISISPRAIN